jgi:hypothetical protein
MNALLVVLGRDDTRRGPLSMGVDALERQGFSQAARFAEPGFEVRAFVAPGSVAGIRLASDVGYAVCAGSMWYRGRFGREALDAALSDMRASGGRTGLDPDAFSGSFTAVLKCGEEAILIGDPLGLQRIYVREDAGVMTTSWLAAVECGAGRRLERTAALEYVLHGAVHGDRTPVREVTSLPADRGFDLARRTTFAVAVPGHGRTRHRCASRRSAVDAVAGHYRDVFAAMASATGGRVRMALSGGFDSRLVLAGLAANGVRPELFVYGTPASSDVAVARTIAAGEGLELKVFDKEAAWRVAPRLTVDSLEASCLFFDGTPVDGILDTGVDRATRLDQYAGGALVLNGGGGEILRNFFHLPDRPYSPRALVHAFYGGHDASAVRSGSDLQALHDTMAASIRTAVGAGGADGAMTRRQVELAYPLFRCRYWMGRNNAVSNRWGQFATPLVDPVAVRLAAELPVAWKQAGAFESDVIAALHPRIAAYASSYGFAFGQPPNRRTRFAEWSTCARPVWARPLIARLRRRIARSRPSAELLADTRRLLGADWRIEALVRLEHLSDDESLHRAATLEHLISTRSIAMLP